MADGPHGAGAPAIAVCVIALDEVDFIASTVRDLRRLQMRREGVHLYVVDGGSTDGTDTVALAEGAELVRAGTVRADAGPVLGKGDSIWRAANIVAEDVVVFLDADIGGDLAHAVENLVAPLERDERVQFVKGYFTRTPVPPDQWRPGTPAPATRGRVTEAVAAPLLSLLAPDLADLREPLSGQVAIRRRVLRQLPIVTGYGVEIAMLFDIAQRYGRDAIVEADLGLIFNPPRTHEEIETTATAVLATALERLARTQRLGLDAGSYDRVRTLAPVERPELGPYTPARR